TERKFCAFRALSSTGEGDTVARTCTTRGGGPVTVQMTERTWQLRAACRGPESALFFPPTTPERKEERDLREAKAKAICRECPVQPECLDYALGIRAPHGIWCGLTEAERRLLITDESAARDRRVASRT